MQSRAVGVSAAIALAILPNVLLAQLPAFPGADGAAAHATGGRGGIVYHVTKLNSAIDDPARFDFGTLRYGLNNNNFPSGPRTIVFDVGGVFSLSRLPQPDVGWDPNGNGWDSQSRLTIGGTNVTLAGQTAPGAGVIFMGGGLKPQGNNNVIRNITVASGYGTRGWWKPEQEFPDPPEPNPTNLGPGIFPDATVYDGMDISGTNLMIDHVSTLYATDETISMNENSYGVTVQYSNISQGQNYPQWDAEGPGRFTGHALGSLLEAGPGAAISFHHNLYAHQKGRVPQTQGDAAYYDFRNNVFYNWLGTAGGINNPTRANLIGNFYLAGHGGDDPVGGQNTGISNENGGTSVVSGGSRVYREGNLLDTNRDDDAEDGSLVSGGASNPLWSDGVVTYAGTTDNAEVAFDRVLNYVGSNWWTRDDVIDTPDERIINEARTGTGKIVAWADDPWNDDPTEGIEWRALKNTPQTDRATDWDTESDVGYGVGDGMPTYWELQHGLDPNARDDTGDFDSDGYTNLEEYLNDIAAWPAANAIVFNNANGDGRYAHILNWDANPDAGSVHPWQPSRYDQVEIATQTAVVDSVGQHAGRVLVGTVFGNMATLNITDGWLKVTETGIGTSNGEVLLGAVDGATGMLNLSGGELYAATLAEFEPDSQFNFTGGRLHVDQVEFDLEVEGGIVAPGSSIGITTVTGDAAFSNGSTLEIELDGTAADLFVVEGNLNLGTDTALEVIELTDATTASYVIAQFTGQRTGEFATAQLPEGFAVNYSDSLGQILLVSGPIGLAGDYNDDGIIDTADYTVWLAALGGNTLLNDPTPGTVDQSDYEYWKANFGATASTAGAAVPEPSTGVLLLVGLAIYMFHTAGSSCTDSRLLPLVCRLP